jgi:hypothetical protein
MMKTMRKPSNNNNTNTRGHTHTRHWAKPTQGPKTTRPVTLYDLNEGRRDLTWQELTYQVMYVIVMSF